MSQPNARRNPQMAKQPDGRQYICKDTQFDVGIPYKLLDEWARHPDFAKRYMAAVYIRIALDRMLIGFYGSSAAAQSNRTVNPLLQDVNTGWLFDLLTNRPENFYLGEGAPGSEEISLGETGTFKNVDQLVYNIGEMIAMEHRTGDEVAIIGQDLVAKDMNKVYGDYGTKPSEKANFSILGKSYGGFKSVLVPQFPAKGVLITDLKNLQIYVQTSSVRRRTKDEPEYSRVADYISQNEAYRIGNLDGAAALDHTKVVFK